MAYDNYNTHDSHSDTRKDVEKAMDYSEKPKMVKCVHCGKKTPTGSNAIGGATMGGSAAGGGGS